MLLLERVPARQVVLKNGLATHLALIHHPRFSCVSTLLRSSHKDFLRDGQVGCIYSPLNCELNKSFFFLDKSLNLGDFVIATENGALPCGHSAEAPLPRGRQSCQLLFGVLVYKHSLSCPLPPPLFLVPESVGLSPLLSICLSSPPAGSERIRL